jgi:hypothetical protein
MLLVRSVSAVSEFWRLSCILTGWNSYIHSKPNKMCMWIGSSLYSGFTVEFYSISLPPEEPLSVLAAPAVYSDHKKWQEMPCEVWTVGTWHWSAGHDKGLEGSSDCHYIHSVLHCEIFTARWATPLECRMMMCTDEHWCSLNTSVLTYHTAVTSHKTMTVTFRYITFKSSLLLLHSGTLSVPAQS